MNNNLPEKSSASVSLRKYNEIPIELLRLVDKINTILMLEPLSEMEVNILAKFIYSEYKDLSLDDIEDSVYKSKSGRLKCNPATYKKLDIDYFGRIVTAYRSFKSEQHLKLKSKREILKLEQPIENSEYQNKIAFDFIKDTYEQSEDMPIIANWISAYNYMEENNLFQISIDDKYSIQKEVISQIKADAARLKSQGINNHKLLNEINDKSFIKLQCIKLFILKYFKDGLYRRT
jgi:hypothetical protein